MVDLATSNDFDGIKQMVALLRTRLPEDVVSQVDTTTIITVSDKLKLDLESLARNDPETVRVEDMLKQLQHKLAVLNEMQTANVDAGGETVRALSVPRAAGTLTPFLTH